MDDPTRTTTGTPPWRERLRTLGEDFGGCTIDDVADGEGRPEAAAHFAGTALDGAEGLAVLLSSPWALHTPEQVGAVAAALEAVRYYAELAEDRLRDVLAAMERRGDVPPSRELDGPRGAPAPEPSLDTADRLFARLSAVPQQRPMPGTYAEALRLTAEQLADLVVPGSEIEIVEEPDHEQHQGYVQLQYRGEQWRLGFHVSEETWFLDDYPGDSPLVELDSVPGPAVHPVKLAETTRAMLAELTARP
ncbi:MULTISPECIES: hypothetical protein [Kitasatospora]|uniref:Uncharacterized protein n=1 Tax=Kitasatospora setae (strain ATCC 33774 / DSM 43861 / JCM 3304 / KCC A-0304 / NBRC 14216 / KM-6054) TaxID=452652 RepID=E4NJY3_KITSK|nr:MULTISPECIES: hypothetical protein [Kitasatospora]BAJ33281.1 hypothetical protein KSE_75280 [Kitasatospora setae KM-6054]